MEGRPSRQFTESVLARRLAFVETTTEEDRSQHAYVRDACFKLAVELNEILPDGREKALAITALEDVAHRAHQALKIGRMA